MIGVSDFLLMIYKIFYRTVWVVNYIYIITTGTMTAVCRYGDMVLYGFAMRSLRRHHGLANATSIDFGPQSQTTQTFWTELF